MRVFVLLILCQSFFSSCKESQSLSKLDKILAQGSHQFQEILDNKDKYEVQILWTPIYKKDSIIATEDHFYNFRPDDYFYPASTVKMPIAFLALEKLNTLRKAGLQIDRNTPMMIDSLRPPQKAVIEDKTSDSGMPTIAHYIEKLFTVSDNDAYNRLYEFTTQDYINSNLRVKNIFTNSRVVHRVGVGGFSFDENKWSPSIHFLDENGNPYHTRKPTVAQSSWITPLSKTQKGVAYIDKDGAKIPEPFDFSKKNFINIRDLQESLKRMILPQLYPEEIQYDISSDDRDFVLETMSKLPKDFDFLLDDPKNQYYDSYVKFFLFGDSKESMPEHIIIRNKVGYAYGYLTDCAYIQDTKENIEYFLTATIHVNDNQTYNDGIYEYDEIGIPFLAELGRLIHQHMIENKNKL